MRHSVREPGIWEPGLGDLDGNGAVVQDEDAFDTAAFAEVETETGLDGFEPWETFPGDTGCYEEVYGSPSRNKWKAKWWNPAAGTPQHAQSRRAMAPASIAELVASGQPKEEIYRAIREAYDVDGGVVENQGADRYVNQRRNVSCYQPSHRPRHEQV